MNFPLTYLDYQKCMCVDVVNEYLGTPNFVDYNWI